jgi:tRNA (guanine-N7-)-methyltransferase
MPAHPRRKISAPPLPAGTVESEFGVPIPGAVLPRERWTPSAIKRWPESGVLDWEAIFARRAPVVLDLGCGNGRSVLLSAMARPDHDHLGVDNLPVVIRYARKRARQRGLGNVRLAVGDARDVVARLVPPHSLAEVCIYHPQPYYDPAEAHRRLITPAFLAHVHRALAPGGRLVLQTDNPAYWRYICQVVPAFFVLHEQSGPWPDAPEGRTRREIIARQRGLPIFRGLAEARTDLDVDAARQAAEAMPPPIFDADRRLLELDALERGEEAPAERPGRRRRRRKGRG